jgi:hypothetical protein
VAEVTCTKCDHSNVEGSKYCSQCAAPLPERKASDSGKKGSGWWAVFGITAAVMGVIFLFNQFSGSGSAKGEIHSRGKPFGDYVLTATNCFSGERESFFGAWVTPKLEDLGDRQAAKGGLKLVKGHTGEWEVYVESPLECESFKCKIRPLNAEHCRVFEVEVRNTNTTVNDMRVREGRAKLDCTFPEGGSLSANLAFDGCR